VIGLAFAAHIPDERLAALVHMHVLNADNLRATTLSVGTAVPSNVRVVAVPPPLIKIHPEWRGHRYFVVRDQIIVVDRNHRIVAIID
jgi:hypothetical protein